MSLKFLINSSDPSNAPLAQQMLSVPQLSPCSSSSCQKLPVLVHTCRPTSILSDFSVGCAGKEVPALTILALPGPNSTTIVLELGL